MLTLLVLLLSCQKYRLVIGFLVGDHVPDYTRDLMRHGGDGSRWTELRFSASEFGPERALVSMKGEDCHSQCAS